MSYFYIVHCDLLCSLVVIRKFANTTQNTLEREVTVKEKKQKNEKQKAKECDRGKKKKRVAIYAIGGTVLTVGAVVAMPKVIGVLADEMYTPPMPATDEDDDWGPEIVKRETTEVVEASGEENSDGEF